MRHKYNKENYNDKFKSTTNRKRTKDNFTFK